MPEIRLDQAGGPTIISERISASVAQLMRVNRMVESSLDAGAGHELIDAVPGEWRTPLDTFEADVAKWLGTAKHPRWDRLYTDLTYQPMQEVLQYVRGSGYKTYIVTGGGQDFVRAYAQRVYSIPPEQVIGTMGGTKFGYTKDGKPFLTKEPKLLCDDHAGKPQGIHLMIGRQPRASFGNSIGDRQMLEYTGAGGGARPMVLVLHDDASVNMPTALRTGSPTARSVPSRRRYTTKPRRMAGQSSA